jgi:hypothetical protein
MRNLLKFDRPTYDPPQIPLSKLNVKVKILKCKVKIFAYRHYLSMIWKR